MKFLQHKSNKRSASDHKSSARIINSKVVEVIAPDGEEFKIFSQIGCYLNEDSRKQQLWMIEEIFDRNFSDNKEEMTNNIWREVMLNGIPFMGMSVGNRQQERVRIGARIREIREERCMDARDLASLAGIDAANLSRIENGKYSVGIDILSKIAAALGKKIDLIDIN